jgi:hypothetical protein
MGRFTAANARENAAKSHAARRLRLANGKPAAESFPQTPQVGPQEAANAYVSARLSRVRVQLDLVDKRITEQANAKTVDGQVLNWLCSAQERLAEQERILAGRPLPGSRRPASESKRAAQPPICRPWVPAEPQAPAACSVGTAPG